MSKKDVMVMGLLGIAGGVIVKQLVEIKTLKKEMNEIGEQVEEASKAIFEQLKPIGDVYALLITGRLEKEQYTDTAICLDKATSTIAGLTGTLKFLASELS